MPCLKYETDGFEDFKSKFDRVLDEMIQKYQIRTRSINKHHLHGRHKLRKDRINFLKNAIRNQAKIKNKANHPSSSQNDKVTKNSEHKTPQNKPKAVIVSKIPTRNGLEIQKSKTVVGNNTEDTTTTILNKSRTTVGDSTSACSSDTNSDATTAIMRERKRKKTALKDLKNVKSTTKVRQSRATLAPDSITTNHARTDQESLENMANYSQDDK